jgi:secretion/DNA translocation related TadE-like protein
VTIRRGLRRSAPPRDPAEGSASLLVAIWVVVLTSVAAVGFVLSSALAVRAKAQAAADLGALAGATAVLEDETYACARAGSIVAANGARLVRCAIAGASMRIEVSVPAPAAVEWLIPTRAGPMRARAHAELSASRP